MNRLRLCTIAVLVLSLSLATGTRVTSQQLPQTFRTPCAIDSGILDSTDATPETETHCIAFSTRIDVAEAAWVQLHFDAATRLPTGTIVRTTSLADGARQELDARTLETYRHWTAAFNGASVLLEVLAPTGSGSASARVVVSETLSGRAPTLEESVCGFLDHRIETHDPRVGRLWLGCTGFLVGPDTMLTAGHCFRPPEDAPRILEMAVPQSDPLTGQWTRAHPDDQYPFVLHEARDGGFGADWAVCRVLPNGSTGLLPTEREGGSWYPILRAADLASLGPATSLAVVGHGETASTALPLRLNAAQTAAVGTLVSMTDSTVCHDVDTTAGNSGSPILDASTGAVVAIHTHGGCTALSGCNRGTRIDVPELRRALASASPSRAAAWFGPGCAGTFGTPELSLRWPATTTTGRVILEVHSLPGRPTIVWIAQAARDPAVELTDLGAPGCSFHVDSTGLATFIESADGDGVARVSITLPHGEAATWFAQAAVLDPAANALGLAFTRALRVTTGPRTPSAR